MSGVPRNWQFDEVFDSLERGCGDFLLELRQVVSGLAPGSRLLVASRDAGAPVEVPTWCHLTGHVLLEARPPFFLLQTRDDSISGSTNDSTDEATKE